MTKPNRSFRGCCELLWCVSLLLLVVGCRTAKVDWNARLGSFTYDQALVELGPPDRLAELTDRSKVAEWLGRRGHTSVYLDTFPGGFYHHPYGIGWHHGYVTRGPDRFLRLVFDPEGKLKSWQWVLR